MEKKLFRCSIFFTDQKYKDTPPSNAFVKAETKEQAAEFAVYSYHQELIKNGYPKVEVRVDVNPSSQSEVEAFIAAREAGHKTNTVLN
jgi:hypothetical protein